MRPVKRLLQNNTIFFNCDIQTRFRDLIYNFNSVVTVAQMMTKAAPIFKIPILVTEQNIKALGTTVEEIATLFPAENLGRFEKTKFSMVTEEAEGFLNKYPERKNVVLYGIEAHVCVQQTTLDLLQMGFNVHLLTDGVSSQRQGDRTTAFERLKQEGAVLTTAESVIFELMRDQKWEDFKKILPILKTDRKNMIPHL